MVVVVVVVVMADLRRTKAINHPLLFPSGGWTLTATWSGVGTRRVDSTVHFGEANDILKRFNVC